MNLVLCGDWRVRVDMASAADNRGARATDLAVTPPPVFSVAGETCGPLPVFKPASGGWAKGYRLAGIETQETTAPGLLDPGSLELRASPDTTSPLLQRGRDYEADLTWGTVGRLEGGALREGQAAFATYRHSLSRIDAIVDAAGSGILLREGSPHAAAPQPPSLMAGETRMGNVWIPGRLACLTDDNLFPVLEADYPAPPRRDPVSAASLIPTAYRKLCEGKPVRILAWGDSVTVASYLPEPSAERWQEQFARRLRERFPEAPIELVTEAWDGHSTGCYLAEPPGSLHHFEEKVLARRPDLVVSEFVNDSWLSPAQVDKQYGRILDGFRGIGAEWVILTPHYMLPEWMGLSRQRGIDEDPRPYVKAVRAFAGKNRLALADASLRWGRLWRQGVPYMTLMTNAINHPDARGMRLFADSLMELF